jgi:hypothetical protein
MLAAVQSTQHDPAPDQTPDATLAMFEERMAAAVGIAAVELVLRASTSRVNASRVNASCVNASRVNAGGAAACASAPARVLTVRVED